MPQREGAGMGVNEVCLNVVLVCCTAMVVALTAAVVAAVWSGARAIIADMRKGR